MLMEESEEMKTAGTQLIKLSADEVARGIAEAREMSKWAWEHTLHATEERGKAEGKAEERAKAEAEKIETAKKFLNEGVDIDIIAKVTQLSKDAIVGLQVD